MERREEERVVVSKKERDTTNNTGTAHTKQHTASQPQPDSRTTTKQASEWA